MGIEQPSNYKKKITLERYFQGALLERDFQLLELPLSDKEAIDSIVFLLKEKFPELSILQTKNNWPDFTENLAREVIKWLREVRKQAN